MSERTPRTRRRARLRLLVPLAVAATLAGCTIQRDEPTTVTMPEHNTTTTAPPGTPGPDTSQAEPPEPLPVAWSVQIGGPSDDTLRAVRGNQATVVAGGSTTTGIGAPTAGGTDALISVVSTEGEVLSVEQSGSAGNDDLTGLGSSDSSVLACGNTDGSFGAPPAGATDTWCGPVDQNGLLGATGQLGGPDADRVTGVAVSDDDATAYVAGELAGLLPGAQDPSGRGLGAGDALAMQTDPNGAPIWARQFGTPVADGALGVTTTGSDGIFVGFTDGDLEGPSNGGRDGWISRFDSTGNQRWVTQVGSPTTDALAAVTVTGEARRGDEQFIAAGTSDGDLDGAGMGEQVGATDAIVASFGTDGSLLWTAQFGSTGADSATAIVADGSMIYVAGTTAGGFGDLIEDGGPGGGDDGFLTAIDAVSREVLWTSRFGSAAAEQVTGITTTEDGLLVVSGITSGQIGEAPANGGTDGFLIAFPLASAGGGAASSV